VWAIDSIIAVCLPALAIWILISGLDDLALDAVLFGNWLVTRRRRSGEELPPAEPEKPIAVFIPLWREAHVIRRMVEHNLAAIRYDDFRFFIGAYPNDEPTLEAVRELAARFPNVHLALCPHAGPTSKADCLNWVYRRMLRYEQDSGTRFAIVVTHDAEDLIHPLELRWLNHYCGRFGMVQLPVLPLRMPFLNLTHGVYCDEFAEYQTKDLPVRGLLGGFIPSNGVGTGYARWAVEALAARHDNSIFDPASLTEDYENGFRLHELGCPQLFVRIQLLGGEPVATREYFPARFRQALRQRTRWVMGNSLQAWQRHGWHGGLRQIYWFWRDRKGLVGNPVSAAANLILTCGLGTLAWSRLSGTPWAIGRISGALPAWALLYGTFFLQLERVAIRSACVARIYGWRFALGVPARVLCANWINFFATVSALAQYAHARVLRRPLAWRKTEHSYPSQAALAGKKRPLGEVLLRRGLLDAARLAHALDSQPPGLRLGEYLIELGHLTAGEVYEALGQQNNIPFETLASASVPVRIARALPAAVARRWRVLPFRVEAGTLFIAGPELPGDEIHTDLRRFTSLEVRFHLITPANFEALADDLLGRVKQ